MARSTGASPAVFTVDYSNPDHIPMSEESEDDNQWLVEAILAKRTRRGVKQYLVSWKGDWSEADKTEWVDEDDLGDELIQGLEASGVVLKAKPPAPEASSPEPTSSVYDDEDGMDISGDDGSDDSGSEYDPDEDDDDNDEDRMDMGMDNNTDKPASKKLPKNSSVKSGRAASVFEQHDHRSRSPSPVSASQVEEVDEVHRCALLGAAMEARAKADLDALDASWEAHGYTFTMQPTTQQPSQAPTVSQTGFTFDPMLNTLPPPVETFRQGPAMMQPAFAQPDQTPMVSQTDFAFDPMLLTEEDAYKALFLDFKATGGTHYSDSEEDAEGLVISEGEQARYDAMSPWPRM